MISNVAVLLLNLAVVAWSTPAVDEISRPRIMIAGDSWGTDIAGGTIVGQSAFQRKLKHQHGCKFQSRNIAIAGSRANQWDHGRLLAKLKSAVKGHGDYLWLTLMGNDAQQFLPRCAAKGTSAQECGDQMRVLVNHSMSTIIQAVHDSNPQTRIVGFGYDIMFGGIGCPLAARKLLPQCWTNTTSDAQAIQCANSEFVKLQQVWDQLANTYEWVETVNLLGSTQMAAKYSGVVVGKPDLTKFGPRKYWPTTLACIHPSILPLKTSGAMVIMQEFYQLYWKKQLKC